MSKPQYNLTQLNNPKSPLFTEANFKKKANINALLAANPDVRATVGTDPNALWDWFNSTGKDQIASGYRNFSGAVRPTLIRDFAATYPKEFGIINAAGQLNATGIAKIENAAKTLKLSQDDTKQIIGNVVGQNLNALDLKGTSYATLMKKAGYSDDDIKNFAIQNFSKIEAANNLGAVGKFNTADLNYLKNTLSKVIPGASFTPEEYSNIAKSFGVQNIDTNLIKFDAKKGTYGAPKLAPLAGDIFVNYKSYDQGREGVFDNTDATFLRNLGYSPSDIKSRAQYQFGFDNIDPSIMQQYFPSQVFERGAAGQALPTLPGLSASPISTIPGQPAPTVPQQPTTTTGQVQGMPAQVPAVAGQTPAQVPGQPSTVPQFQSTPPGSFTQPALKSPIRVEGSAVDPQLRPYLNLALTEAERLFFGKPQPSLYPGQMYVSPSVQTLEALDIQEQIARSGGGVIQQGLDAYGRSLAQTGATASGQMLGANPFLMGAVSAAQRPVVQQFSESVLPGLQSSYAAAGRLGSGAMARGVGSAVESYGRSLGDISSRMVAEDYSRERAFQEAARTQQAALAQQAPFFFASQFLPSEQLAQVGAAREAIEAQPLQESIQRYQFEQQLPYSQLSGYLAAIQGQPSTTMFAPQQQQQQQQQQTNRAGSFLGGAALGASVGQALSSQMPTIFGLPTAGVGAGIGALAGLLL